MSETARWLLRLLLAFAAAAFTTSAVLERLDDLEIAYPPVQVEALLSLNDKLEKVAAAPREPLNILFFGDSLALPADVSWAWRSLPIRVGTHLGTALAEAKIGKATDVALTPIIYSGLSQWSLYYITDRMMEARPDVVVIQFNLYNFSAFWRHRDRKVLAAFLDLGKLPELVTLPTSVTGLATDQWIFDNLLLHHGALLEWHAVQREQARCIEAYWHLADSAQKSVESRPLTLRSQNRVFELRDNKLPGLDRATPFYARKLLGQTLTGVDEDDAALRMLSASLSRFRSAGIRTLVYIPPYNMEHLASLGVLAGSRFQETIGHVRAVAEAGGASFLDLHDILPDEFFRDSMDHLSESDATNGHEEVAKRVAAALVDDSRRILAERR